VQNSSCRELSNKRALQAVVAKKMVSPQLLKQVVVVMRSEVEVSERRACGLTQIHRGTYRYRRRPKDGRLRARLRVLAEERRRFGYHGCRWSGFGNLVLWAGESIA
jgi:hypothetical protein